MLTIAPDLLPTCSRPAPDLLPTCSTRAALQASKHGSFLLEDLEHEIRHLPTPCTRAQLEPALSVLAEGQPGGRISDATVREVILQLGILRKQPIVGGRRGSKAAPIPAHGLWNQIAQHTDEKYVAMQSFAPQLMYVLGAVAAGIGMKKLALQLHEKTGEYIVRSAAETPELVYRHPVELWLASTHVPGPEQTTNPPAWIAAAKLHIEQADQSLNLLKKLSEGVEIVMDSEMLTLTMLSVRNTFNKDEMHPAHYRNAACHMLLTSSLGSIAVLVDIEHETLLAHYKHSDYSQHYEFFVDRDLSSTSAAAFDQRFELLLVFLVEAIGVPVLLSLLLLSYASMSSSKDVLDLNELPDGRLQLYKMGILSGIRKRMLLTIASDKTGAEDQTKAAEDDKAAAEQQEGHKRRERRKGALEQGAGQSFGSGGGGGAAVQASTEKTRGTGGHSTEPVLDLNSILRGKKVRVVTGEEDVAECYSLVVRVLDKSKQAGFDMRSGITTVVPKSHTMHAPVSALVEYVMMPSTQNEAALFDTCKKMLRRVAVDNQENGRREFTSKNVACALGGSPEELGLWSRLDLDHDHGVALAATLAKQSDKAPAQYQFKHLSFQEGLYAEHLLILVTSLAPPMGAGWHGWATHQAAATFLNNRYMNNTCRIAAGHLGALLGRQRSAWDFSEENARLSANGRSALWFITDENDKVESINVAKNDVTFEDVPGIVKMLATCSSLQAFDVSDNELYKMLEMPASYQRLCDSLSNNLTLTDLNLNNNKLGQQGTKLMATALRGCSNLKRLGFSHNEPGVEIALADLMRVHTSLETLEIVETLDRHLPSRAKDDIGRALLENKKKSLSFLHCDMFVLSEHTKSLTWPKEASSSDAVLLAGVLATNTVLTTFNIAPGATVDNKARSELGEALLNNPNARVSFCNDFGLSAGVDTCEFDLSRTELKDVEPFRLLAGCLRGNRTLTHVTLKQLRMEQISTLALALRGNDTLARLDMINASRMGGQSVVRLPVPELNGSKHKEGDDPTRVDLSTICIEGGLGRVSCAMIGTLIATNTVLEFLDLSNTAVGSAIGAEGEGGHILLRPLFESAECPIKDIDLTNTQLNDKAGGKLLSALLSGLGKGDSGYDKLTSMRVSRNDLGKQFTNTLKQLLWGERAPCMLRTLDVSHNPTLDGYDMAIALKRNDSLTTIDFRGIPNANSNDIYSFLGNFLLQDECMCRLGFLSCDAFQVRDLPL